MIVDKKYSEAVNLHMELDQYLHIDIHPGELLESDVLDNLEENLRMSLRAVEHFKKQCVDIEE